MPKQKDLVIFRRWKADNGNSVIAMFPEIPADRNGYHCEMYEHVGQHGGGDLAGVVQRSRPADIDEPDVLALFRELNGRGYDLKIVFKESQKMRDVRRAAAQAVVSGARVK